MINPDEIIEREATKAFGKTIQRVAGLEGNDYFRIIRVESGAVSDPPQQTELDSIFGTSGTFNGIPGCLLLDSATKKTYWCLADNVAGSWYYVLLTKAL